jgi:arylsulfatase A-like enzyme
MAVRLGGLARLDAPAFGRFVRAGLPVLVGAWLILFVATGLIPAISEARALAGGPRPPAGAPNVLLVVLDTVRADHMSLHGYPRPTTPRLAERARRGVRFDEARATTPYTLGTHASLFTGRWMSETSARVDTPLDGAHPTLAEHLRDRGYATAGFTGNIFYGSARYGLDRGFLHYHDIPGNITRRATPREVLRSCSLGETIVTWLERKWRILAPMQRRRLDAAELNREALAWLDHTRAAGRPFFLFLNYFDAHSPYTLPGDAPQPFARRAPHLLEDRLKRLDGDDATPAERAEVHALAADCYDDGIAWIDRKLDELLAALDRRGVLNNTLVIVTSDHGEMLGEHGLFGHGQTLHRPVVHVPLIVLGGRGMDVPAGAVVPRPVSVRDVPATVLDLIGDPRPGRFPGRSLARFWSPDAAGPPAADDVVFSEVQHMPWASRTPRMPVAFGPMWLLTEGRWAYHRQAHESAGIHDRLFDLEADPGEERDLASDPARREVLRALRERLERTIR